VWVPTTEIEKLVFVHLGTNSDVLMNFFSKIQHFLNLGIRGPLGNLDILDSLSYELRAVMERGSRLGSPLPQVDRPSPTNPRPKAKKYQLFEKC
jgi:hypothetical protein